jgi:hypothetical protein
MQGFITESQKVVEQLTELTRTQWAIAEAEVTATEREHGGNGNGHATATRSSRRRS